MPLEIVQRREIEETTGDLANELFDAGMGSSAIERRLYEVLAQKFNIETLAAYVADIEMERYLEINSDELDLTPTDN